MRSIIASLKIHSGLLLDAVFSKTPVIALTRTPSLKVFLKRPSWSILGELVFAFHGLVFEQYKLVFKPRDCLNDFFYHLIFLKFCLLFGFMIIFISMALLKVCSSLLWGNIDSNHLQWGKHLFNLTTSSLLSVTEGSQGKGLRQESRGRSWSGDHGAHHFLSWFIILLS